MDRGDRSFQREAAAHRYALTKIDKSENLTLGLQFVRNDIAIGKSCVFF